jgi:hypothetical protein
VQTLNIGGQSYAMPTVAMPYLGRGLDLSLFDLTALANSEPAGRLPVQVTYPGAGRPGRSRLPGITITKTGAGIADGYLTAAGARRFGAALARQFAADHARASYGQDGMFGNGVSVALAGRAPAAPRPTFAMHTLTVTATTLAGKPDTGDMMWLFNADNATRFDNPNASISVFYRGVTKYSVPAGHYWGVAAFFQSRQGNFNQRLVILPEFTVGDTGTGVVRVQESAAASKVQTVTPRPALSEEQAFTVVRFSAAGPYVSLGWTIDNFPGQTAAGLYVSPTKRARPSADCRASRHRTWSRRRRRPASRTRMTWPTAPAESYPPSASSRSPQTWPR